VGARVRVNGTDDRRGVRNGFEGQVHAVLDPLYDFACALVPPPEADDLLQVACLRALEHHAGFAEGTSFKTWIFTILRNEFIDRHRRDRRRSELLELAIPIDGGAPGLDAVLIEHQWKTEVREALSGLPEGFRIPVYLKDVAGFAYREIAEVVGCPLGTVMSRLARGRALLRASLAKQARERGLLRAGVHRVAR
jgi:RNA polymerase sigma-70 factor, ECF subfamily